MGWLLKKIFLGVLDMSIFHRIIPKFWHYQENTTVNLKNIGPFEYKPMLNFKRIWKAAIFLIIIVAIIPLISMSYIDYKATQKAVESEFIFQISRLVSNTRRSVSFFFAEHKSALDFTAHNTTFSELNNYKQLAIILDNLEKSFGGFADLGIIDSNGNQKTYVGYHNLKGRDYSKQPWFNEITSTGNYISDVFKGFRDIPHIVVAIKRNLPNDSFFVLRAAIDIKRFNKMLSQLQMSGAGDAFIINNKGILQTPTKDHGKILEKISIPVPEYSSKTQVIKQIDSNGEHLLIGYAYITETPFILMIVKREEKLMKLWHNARKGPILFLAISIIIILFVTLGVTTYLVNQMYLADLRRIRNLHYVEYSNKMASIGRLAAGVAHEINNPLAIINEKAGLINDLFTFQKKYANDPKLAGIVNAIISSVDRCGLITKRLLNFARNDIVRIKTVNIKETINEALAFQEKEAEYKCIIVTLDIPDDIPSIKSDWGKLQQIFLNLISNAIASMENGGNFVIKVIKQDNSLAVMFIDNGCGIPLEDLEHIFEPFFSTKIQQGGTGLGLSITYGLVREIGGSVTVESQIGKGSTFTVFLPLV